MDIKTTDGLLFQVDDADADWVSSWNWRTDKDGYVIRGMREYGYYVVKRLHRELANKHGLLLGNDSDYGVYHLNKDKLDNRMENLEVRPKKFLRAKRWVDGVCRDKEGVGWRAYIDVFGRLKLIGLFPNKAMAERAYQQYKEYIEE